VTVPHTPSAVAVRRRLPRTLALAPALLAVGLVASACGGGGTSSASAAGASPTPAPGNASRGGGAFPRGVPGTSGLVAAVDGKTLQVQGSGSQTAVTYTGTTRFTQTRTATPAAVEVGLCATVRSANPSASASAAPTSVAAASVMVSTPVNGSCFGGAAFGGFGGGQRFNGTRPSGAPSTGPNGTGRARGLGVTGKITSVTGSGFVVQGERRAGTGTPSPTTTTVTTTSATTYTATVAATSAAAKVGTCVTAVGKTDDAGAVTATSISVRPPVNGTCSFGFGRRGADGSTSNGTTGA
jgi:hypothetical protein